MKTRTNNNEEVVTTAPYESQNIAKFIEKDFLSLSTFYSPCRLSPYTDCGFVLLCFLSLHAFSISLLHRALFLLPAIPSTHHSSAHCFSVQFSSVAQSCPTLYDPMNLSTPGLPVHHQLREFTQTHVHRVGDAI